MSALPLDAFKLALEKHFSIGDEIVCAKLNQTLRVTAVNEDRVDLISAPDGDVIQLDLAALSATLAQANTGQAVGTAMDCFAQEYESRAEQAQRDQAVDDMWKSAIVCQL